MHLEPARGFLGNPGGFHNHVLRANSKEEAIQLARDFLQVAGEGECEFRQIFEADTCVQKAATP